MSLPRKVTLPGVTASVLVIVLGACAQSPTPATDERTERLTSYFDAADTSGDGVLDTAEINAEADADFDTLDYNGDGVITIEDVYNDEQAAPEGAAPVTDLSQHLPYDLNSDGTITREEYRSYLDTELLAEMDTDGDGRISFAEYRAFEEF